jgi:hypothetical protein
VHALGHHAQLLLEQCLHAQVVGSIDVALTEAAMGGDLTRALLLGAVRRLRGTEAATAAERAGRGLRMLAALLALAVTAALMLARSEPAGAGADAGAAGHVQPAGHASRQPHHRRAAGLPRA